MDDSVLERRIDAYRRLVEALNRGEFPHDLMLGGGDALGRLGCALVELARSFEQRFGELKALLRLTREINAGVLLDEVLEHVYESFRPIIPYDRIGLALLEDDNRIVRARWARSDATPIYLGRGYAASLAGSSLERILATGQPRILGDLRAHPQFPGP